VIFMPFCYKIVMKRKITNKDRNLKKLSIGVPAPYVKIGAAALEKKKLGSMGESAASTYLKNKGHLILGRNIRLKRGEIDILTVKDKTLHIVEVKTGFYTDAIVPEDSFSKNKINKLKGLVGELLMKYPSDPLFKPMYEKSITINGLVLNDEPAIQLDGVVVRIDVTGEKVSKVLVKYYPFLD
jgi:Holliday junction resolvase-like predicted endonuclease